MELQIDSVVEGALYGRLRNYFAGNVGAGADEFPHFAGSVDSVGLVTIAIGHATVAASGFELHGTASPDTILLDTFVIGPDTVRQDGAVWRLVRSTTER
jgi:hypothetical protein